MERDNVTLIKQKFLLKEMFDVAMLKEQLNLLIEVNNLISKDCKQVSNDKME